MGSFKKTTGWAAQAIQLAAGNITVDYALLDANLADEYQRAEAHQRKKWANKRNNTTSISPVREAMMYFECPAAPSDKGGKPREYSVAMTHIDRTTKTLASSPYTAFWQLSWNVTGTNLLNDDGFWNLATDQRLSVGHSSVLANGADSNWVADSATSIAVHDPWCKRIDVLPYWGFGTVQKRIQLLLHNKLKSNCKYDYPQEVQIKSNITAYSPDRIIVTGHSLGGGVATLLSYALAKEVRDSNLLTPSVRVDAELFAPPTVGDQAFLNEFNTLVNARRIAFAATWNRYTQLRSRGDPVAQVLCPTMPTCFYNDQGVVSQKPPPARPATYINYEAVDGNIFFSARDMPTATYTGVPPDAIRDNYKKNDRLEGIVWMHICSYSCYTSTAVHAPLNRCFGGKNAEAAYGGYIPEDVRLYGLCMVPPPVLPDNELYGVDQVYYPGP